MPFNRILVAVDGSAGADHAVDVGAQLAKGLSAELGLVSVVDPAAAVSMEAGPPSLDLLAMLREEAKGTLERALQRAGGTATALQREGAPATEIINAAKQWGAAIVVLGTHGRTGLGRLLMGSTAENVSRHSPVPVLITRMPQAPAKA
jgi:nucleotide-binding universal stress UspA family protein